MISDTERKYIIWQNRAFRFYLAARLLYQNDLYSPAAFCALQAIETLLKATLIYWDKSFVPEEAGHKIASMIRSIKNKVKNGKKFYCPEYFYKEKRFQSITRYPTSRKGVLVPASFLRDLDKVFFDLITLVPFQFNSDLIHAISGKKNKDLRILRRNNLQIRKLRKYLNVKLEKKV